MAIQEDGDKDTPPAPWFEYLLPLAQLFQGDAEQSLSHSLPKLSCGTEHPLTLQQGRITQLLPGSCCPTAPGLDGCRYAESLCSHLRTRGGLSWHQHRLLGVRSFHSLLHTEEVTPFLGREEKITLWTDCCLAAPSKVACIIHSHQQQKAAAASSKHRQHLGGSAFMFQGSWTPQKKHL